jgi:hypothetical protein
VHAVIIHRATRLSSRSIAKVGGAIDGRLFMLSIRRWSVIAVSLASFAIAGRASAQGAPAPAPPPPPGPPPAEAEPPGAHTHDGFYLRLGLGLGYMTDSQTKGFVDKVSGTGSGYLLSIGGTPIPGLVIAGTMFTHLQPKPHYELGATSGDTANAFFLFAIGPTVDYFPDPKGGLHFGGGPLYGTYNTVNYTSTGFALTAFGGYDLWIGKNWSFGPSLQLTYNHSGKDQATDSTTSIALMFSFLDH